MQHSNGQLTCKACPHAPPTETPVEITLSLFPDQKRFIQSFLERKDALMMAESLQVIFDLAVYHSEVDLRRKEKDALRDVRDLILGLESFG